jgi:hypothetical protein
VRGAGTDADISVILVGEQGSSREMRLESSADNFERGKVRTRLVSCKVTVGNHRYVAFACAQWECLAGSLSTAYVSSAIVKHNIVCCLPHHAVTSMSAPLLCSWMSLCWT